MCSSNLAEGFLAFTTAGDEFKVQVRNEAHNTIPFVTPRIVTNRELATHIANAHKKMLASGGREPAHPDATFVAERFAWKGKGLEPEHVSRAIEPPSLWGSHTSENFLANWARELGVATCKVIRMAPELVAISAMEQAKLRAATKRALEGLDALRIA
jgi:hypothetical protein